MLFGSFTADKKAICSLCKREANVYITFPALVGRPIICEKCLVTALGVKNAKWRPEVLGELAKPPRQPGFWERLFYALGWRGVQTEASSCLASPPWNLQVKDCNVSGAKNSS